MTRCVCALLAGLLFFSMQALAQSWRIYPPAPTAGEPFVIQYEASTGNGPDTVRSASVTVEGSTLFYSFVVDVAGFSAGGSYRASTVVPGLAAGTYQVVVQRRVEGIDTTATAGSITVLPAEGPAAPAYHGLDGNWFEPNESGWGMNIVQGDSGALFAAWLTYLPIYAGDAGTGRRDGMWLVMPAGRWLSPTKFRGLLYSTLGTSSSRPFDRSDLRVIPVGYLSIDLSSATQATMKGEAAVGVYAPFAKEASIRRFQF
jgi:hypothetical protein